MADRSGQIKTITLRSDNWIQDEGPTSTTVDPEIYPGQVVDNTGTSIIRFAGHATAAGATYPVQIAIENQLEGETVLDAYGKSTIVQYRTFRPGDLVAVRCLETATRSYAKGEQLVLWEGTTNEGTFRHKTNAGTLVDVAETSLIVETATSVGTTAALVVARVIAPITLTGVTV